MNLNQQPQPPVIIEQQNVTYPKTSFGQTIGGIIATSGAALLGVMVGVASIITACRF